MQVVEPSGLLDMPPPACWHHSSHTASDPGSQVVDVDDSCMRTGCPRPTDWQQGQPSGVTQTQVGSQPGFEPRDATKLGDIAELRPPALEIAR